MAQPHRHPPFAIRVDESRGVMITEFTAFDDDVLVLYAYKVREHPQYNCVKRRILDVFSVEHPTLTYDGVANAFEIFGKSSKQDVEAYLLAKEEHVSGFARLYEVHADSLPFELKITSDPSILSETPGQSLEEDARTLSAALRARLDATLNKANEAVSTSELNSLIKHVEEQVGLVDPEIGKIFNEVKRAYAEDSVFASTAGAHELVRRLTGGDADIYNGVMKLVDSNSFSSYLTPLIRLHDRSLQREAIGDASAAQFLLRLCTVLIIYEIVLPSWVESYLTNLDPS